MIGLVGGRDEQAVREALGPVNPVPDEQVQGLHRHEDARRLRDEITRGHRVEATAVPAVRPRPRLLPAVVAAVVIVAAMVLPAVLVAPGSEAPDEFALAEAWPSAVAFAQDRRDPQELIGQLPAPVLGSDEPVRYEEREVAWLVQTDRGPEAARVVSQHREVWRNADGQEHIEERLAPPTFLTEDEREVWRERLTDPDAAGEFEGGTQERERTEEEVADHDLPPEPRVLLDELATAYEVHPGDHERLAGLLVSYLGGFTPAEVRNAAARAFAELEPTEALGTATDRYGREIVAIGIDREGAAWNSRHELHFHRATGELVGYEEVLLQPIEEYGLEPGDVIHGEWLLASGTSGSLGETPQRDRTID
ncbi:hypothetical protein ER308_03485 [Egibacter rhizosphaerae]|uniref:CU044_5270 family protein n=1 Tax=Egibacter rhizosphaerae TaxID=1670831 RepID=A0A411YC28_9ACTN|nr:hypothetical protein [Egibacter rhizosphaerae]QBI18707.1 hypothetical protein ER308_03485 [Egibacter rhizosphaerae]